MDFKYRFTGRQRVAWRSGGDRWSLPTLELNAARITMIYMVFGMAALVVSDYLLVGLLSDPILAQVQALKGTVEVVLTGGLIFALTRTRERQLREVTSTLEQERDELHLLHRVVRHNLRNDINVLYGCMDLLTEDRTTAESSDLHRTVYSKLEEMEGNLERLRQIRQVTASTPATTTATVPDAIYSVIGSHPEITGDEAISVSCPGEITIECNHMLREGIAELLTNAITHNTADTPTIDIDVAPEDSPPGTVAIHITDNGPGLPKQEIDAIQARRNGELSQVLHSNGIGIWFVDWMITHSGGDLQVDVSNPDGTRITLCLPRAEAE